MSNILDIIVTNKRIEIERLKETASNSFFAQQEGFRREPLSLTASVLNSDFGIIAEIKRKSPSGGSIHESLNPIELSAEYQQNGAAAISVLTDLDYFGGTIEDIKTIRPTTQIPILRKEFIIDEIQLFEAKAAGADAVLLIAALLDKQEAHHLTIVAKSIGLEVLFEVHAIEEIAKINDEVDLIAVNNRNLKIQETSLEQSFKLAPFLPDFAPLISASGISNRLQIEELKAAGFAGGLIGESILRENHLSELILTPVK